MKKNQFFILLALIVFFVFGGNFVFAYSDVVDNSDNSKAIDYISNLKVINGYSDGTFRSNANISRAEFIKIAVLAKKSSDFSGTGSDCFKDVKAGHWFSPYICYSKGEKIVKGGLDGRFLPENSITIVEASKILIKVFSDANVLEDGKYWYSSYISYLADKNYIPTSIHYTNQNITRGETAEMIWRMMEDIDNLPSIDASTLDNNYCKNSPENIPSNIDMNKVRAQWLSWYNDVRGDLGLNMYVYDSSLNASSIVWSEYAKKRGFIDHKRSGQSAYYDYNKVKSWFKNLGLTFKNVNGDDFTENINWGYYKCSSNDCTQGLINGIKSGFDFFMSEKGKSYRPHYNSIVNNHFKVIGLGIAIDPVKKKYYLTVHYGTSVTSNSLPVCR